MLSEFIAQIHLNRYKDKIAATTRLPLEFKSLLAHTTWLTRLRSTETSLHQQVIWNATANAIAPILFGFVYWCLVEAEKKGIQRLYFVARDGQILQRIAQVICQNWGFTIDCRYLYGSRQAWHIPASRGVGKDELEWWMLFGSKEVDRFLSIRSICDKLSISPERIKDTLNRYGFSAETWDVNLPQHDRDLLQQVFTQPEVTELITSIAADYRDKAIGYFRQEGLDDGVPFGYVDIGWAGNVQRSLSKLLSLANLYPESGVCGFYFALNGEAKPFQSDRLQAYFSPDRSTTEFICKYRCLFELFVAADHGSTTSYRQCGDRYVPVLRSPKNERAIEWGLSTMQSAAVEFATQMTTSLKEPNFSTDLFLEAAEILAKEFVLNPSPQEARVFGSFLTSGGAMSEIAFSELAPVYSFTDWWNLMFFDRHPHADVWFPAVIARDNAIVRNLFALKETASIRKIRKFSGLGKLKQKLLLQSQTN